MAVVASDAEQFGVYKAVALNATCRLPHDGVDGRVIQMVTITIRELQENTAAWVRKATELEPVVLTHNGKAIARIVPVTAARLENPFRTRKLLPGFGELQAKLSGGTDSTQIVSEMRDGR